MKLAGFSLTLALVGLLAACGNGSGSTADATEVDAPDPIDAVDAPPDGPPINIPSFRNPVDMTDLELARAAAARLGVGTNKACDTCHALTRDTFTRWLAETQAADACFTTLTPTSSAQARTILNCFRDQTEHYGPGKLGIYTTGAALGWFNAITQVGYGADATAEWAEWTGRVAMPRGGLTMLTQGEFDIVAEWFARDLPQLDAVINDIPPPDGCTQDIQPEVGIHVAAMATQGWRALNAAAGINMFGCQGAATALDCLSTFPLSTSNSASARWGEAAPSTKLRILYQYNYGSSFWTRSSADGRFVAHGGGTAGGSTIIDLQQNRQIGADAQYDPGFFPDNSGFVIQGGAKEWCRQSLLTSSPTHVTFNESQCTNITAVGLYQHLGAVAGGDYWAVAGQFVSDSGGGEPGVTFGSTAACTLTPMIWNGTSYTTRPGISVAIPFEGDAVISPSAKMMLNRTAFMGQQSGFTLRKINATPNATSYDVTAPVVGRYCVSGGKPGFSYDDRWIVYHHWVQPADWASLGYASASDPEFIARRQSPTANVFLLDLTTGVTRRITHMNPGQEALFPHFRSDGWIYFIVKQAGPTQEAVVASDAALVYE